MSMSQAWAAPQDFLVALLTRQNVPKSHHVESNYEVSSILNLQPQSLSKHADVDTHSLCVPATHVPAKTQPTCSPGLTGQLGTVPTGNFSALCCICWLLFAACTAALHPHDEERKMNCELTFSTTGGTLLNVKSFFYSVIHSSQEEAFKRASARREVWQYHFLCLSACETATNTFLSAILIFTELPCLVHWCFCDAEHSVVARLPDIFQKHFLGCSQNCWPEVTGSFWRVSASHLCGDTETCTSHCQATTCACVEGLSRTNGK